MKAADSGETEARARRILARMTWAEKLGQMSQYAPDINTGPELGGRRHFLARAPRGRVGSVLNIKGARRANEVQGMVIKGSRLGIPVLIGNDVIHGYRTHFPIPLGETASWDMNLLERTAAAAAREARAAGTHWTFAPMVDVGRDPRWGRVAEGAGEDPFLGSLAAAARVRGFQGKDVSSPESVAACAKHYAGYGAAEGGRDYNFTDFSPRTMEEVYLPPFRAAVKAGVETLMSAFNDISGVPASGNRHLLGEVLRKRWGFKGFVVSDWDAIGELTKHGLAEGRTQAGNIALEAGVDMDMMSNIYGGEIEKAIRHGGVSKNLVNQAVLRILRLKLRLGLFENPWASEAREAAVVYCGSHRDLAFEAASKSMVLLKNEGGVLPLKPKFKRIAVIGPLAEDRRAPLGCWVCDSRLEDTVTLAEGIRRRAGSGKVVCAKGCEITGEDTKGFRDALRAAREADVVVAAVGESARMSGEANCRSSLDLPGRQEDLLKALHALGKPVIMVLQSGRAMSFPWAAQNLPAIVSAWHPGSACGDAVASLLFGDFNPSGRLPVSFPRTVGQIPVYYSHRMTGRPEGPGGRIARYVDLPGGAQYPFGYGLGYTRFQYSGLRLSAERVSMKGRLAVSAVVKNVGRRTGAETVQLYVRDVAGSTTRPVRELKGFERVELGPGESRRVSFVLRPESLAFCGPRMEWIVEPGEFKVWIAPDSSSGLEGTFSLSSA